MRVLLGLILGVVVLASVGCGSENVPPTATPNRNIGMSLEQAADIDKTLDQLDWPDPLPGSSMNFDSIPDAITLCDTGCQSGILHLIQISLADKMDGCGHSSSSALRRRASALGS